MSRFLDNVTIIGSLTSQSISASQYTGGNVSKWDSTYTTVYTYSAGWGTGGGGGGSDVSGLSGNWQSTYSTVSSTSANWNASYTWVNSNSGSLTTSSLDSRYVNVSGDTMTGPLQVLSSVSIGVSGTPAYIYYASNTSGNPGIRYSDGANGAWQISNNGVIYSDIQIKGGAGALLAPIITNNGNATVSVSSTSVILYSLSGWQGSIAEYVVPGSANMSVPVNNSFNYLTVKYNNANPLYYFTSTPTEITDSDVILVASFYREGNDMHYVENSWGLSTASRINRRLVDEQTFVRTSGLTLGETTGNVITISDGVLWWGIQQFEETSVTSASSGAQFYYHVGGTWVHTDVSTYNNTQYDDGVNLQTLTPGRYTVNWVYRFVDGSNLPKIGYILGNAQYTSVALAAAALVPASIPPIFAYQAILVGRIIVQKSAATASQIDSAFTQVFAGTTVTNHNDLANIQGGTTGEHYHLTNAEYVALSANYSNFTNYNNTYTTVNTNSASAWNYQGTDLKALSGNWQSTYGTVSALSANWNTAYNELSSRAYTFIDTTSSIQPIHGNNSTASGCYSNIGGGKNNSLSNCYVNTTGSTYVSFCGVPGTIAGGECNTIVNVISSTISGYYVNNSVACGHHFIGGGICNTAGACTVDGDRTTGYSVVAGGYCNKVEGYASSIVGGGSNCIVPNADANHSFIGGGLNNIIIASGSGVIAGGSLNNQTNSGYSFIGSGRQNCQSTSHGSFTGSGCYNYHNCTTDGVIVGGNNNSIQTTNSNYYNFATCFDPNKNFIGGGLNNTIISAASADDPSTCGSIVFGCNFIGSGACNSIVQNMQGGVKQFGYSSIVGGKCNTASGIYSSIVGGRNNTINSLSGVFILGNNIVASQSDTTYVNSLCVTNTRINNVPLSATNAVSINFAMDGGGAVLVAGQVTYMEVPYSMTVTGWTLMSNTSGTLVVGVSGSSSFPTFVAIDGGVNYPSGDRPSLNNTRRTQDLSIPSWTTTINTGDVLAFTVLSASSVSYATLAIRGIKR